MTFVSLRESWGGARCGEEVPPLRFAAVGTTGEATTFDSLVIGRQPENDVGQRPGRRWRALPKGMTFVSLRESWGGARCGEEVPPLRFAAVGTTGGATIFASAS